MITLPDERVGKLLVGHPVVVSVSEPFGFEYPDGENVLRGRVVEVESKEGVQQIRLEVAPFVSKEGPTVRHLVARRRHKIRAGIVELLAAGERVEANLSYSDEAPEGKRVGDGIPKLVGGLRLAD